MPVFLGGEGLARSIACMYKVPLVRFSHQEVHIWSGIYSAKGPLNPPFLVLHISGGTTELLLVEYGENYQLNSVLLGESIDLYARQFVDGIGVAPKHSTGNAVGAAIYDGLATYGAHFHRYLF